MSHLSEPLLRRYVDEPDALLSYEKEHLLQCGVCRTRLDQTRERAGYAARALHTDDSVDMQAAHLKLIDLMKRPGAELLTSKVPRRVSPRVTQWAGAVAAVFALFVLIGYAPVRTYAQNFLAIFEPHQFQPIGITTADIQKLQSFPGLQQLGTIHNSNQSPGMVAHPDVASASKDAGYAILRPHFLPNGLPNEVIYHVTSRHTASFTFSAAKAPALPPNLAGATLSISVGPISVQTFGEKRAFAGMKNANAHRFPRTNGPGLHDIPRDVLVVSQSPAMRVYSSGATLTQIEAYLLAQPGLPANVVKQLRAIADPGSTLPVPINVDKQTAQQVVVHGSNALLIGDNTGVGAVAVWQQNGMVYCVAGPYAASVIVQVANSLAQ